MQSYYLNNRFFLVLCTLLVLGWLFAGVVNAKSEVNELESEDYEVDAVWSTSDGIGMEIFYSNRKDGVWSEPIQVTDDYFDNMYPVIDRDSLGRMWTFWTAYYNGRTEIHYSVFDGKDWKPGEFIVFDQKSNVAPSVVIDGKDKIWITWSANDGGFDDILFAYYQNGSWSEPVRLHAENDIPDVLPTVELEPDGNPVINWRMLADGKYITVTSRWTGSEWSEVEPLDEEAAEDKAEVEENLLELPPFMSKSSAVFIRAY